VGIDVVELSSTCIDEEAVKVRLVRHKSRCSGRAIRRCVQDRRIWIELIVPPTAPPDRVRGWVNEDSTARVTDGEKMLWITAVEIGLSDFSGNGPLDPIEFVRGRVGRDSPNAGCWTRDDELLTRPVCIRSMDPTVVGPIKLGG